ALTLSGAPFQGTWARSIAEDASPDYNSNVKDVQYSTWALPGSLAESPQSKTHARNICSNVWIVRFNCPSLRFWPTECGNTREISFRPISSRGWGDDDF
ncbi:unnamed protein product, partial [Brassica rapa]